MESIPAHQIFFKAEFDGAEAVFLVIVGISSQNCGSVTLPSFGGSFQVS